MGAVERQRVVLVIVGDQDVRENLTAILRTDACVVIEAGTGRDGLELAAWDVDLVIVDIDLPDASGLEVCRTIRATRRAPVIVLSDSSASASLRMAAIDCGAAASLTKPVKPRALLDLVRSL